MENYNESCNSYQSSECYHGNCTCDNPNCQGKCRCNCKCHTEDSFSSSTSDNMCNSVFGPICEPEVCDIPRFPHSQDLVVGNGTICGDQECTCEEETDETSLYEKIDYRYDSDRCKDDKDRCEHGCYDDCAKQYRFTIHIHREFTSNLGEFALYDGLGKLILHSEKLECYHAPTEDNMVAIFHVVLDDDTSREVTIYAKNKTCESPAALFVYSAPLFHTEIRVGSELLQGELNIFPDKVSHEH